MTDDKRFKGNAEKKGCLDYFPDICETASSMECTGMMPAPARDESELESYSELFSSHMPGQL